MIYTYICGVMFSVFRGGPCTTVGFRHLCPYIYKYTGYVPKRGDTGVMGG
jgi:hypothetical protein